MTKKMIWTAKQLRFRDIMASGATYADAYRGAYDAENMSDQSVWEEASRLMARPEMIEVLDKLRHEAAEKAGFTVEASAKRFDTLGEKAEAAGQFAAANRAEELRVTSRTSVMQYKTARKPLPEIARGLKVDGIIEGSVVREGDRVRVTAQLIDGRRDHLVWVDSYERDVRGILALQSEIARTVAKQIRLQLTPREEELLAGPLARWFAKVRRIEVPED